MFVSKAGTNVVFSVTKNRYFSIYYVKFDVSYVWTLAKRMVATVDPHSHRYPRVGGGPAMLKFKTQLSLLRE